jgi:hypothetical protein
LVKVIVRFIADSRRSAAAKFRNALDGNSRRDLDGGFSECRAAQD